ncbi:MAG: glycogen/starch synthase [Dehalococcoidia bacterium]|nr:glycogen/starch synthase [Dehalococcoidia bacterium]
MRVLFATAELVPLTRVGGLGEASAGLVRELRALGHDVDVVLPDYTSLALRDEDVRPLDVPQWVGTARARSGVTEAYGRVTLLDVPGIARPHPYNDPATGEGWPDNIQRFFAFSAAVAALTEATRPDVLHLNDWHTSPALGMLTSAPPSVLTIHNLAYQGVTDGGWLDRLPVSTGAYLRGYDCNALQGGVRLAQRVIAVSPNYAREILRPEDGFGLDDVLRDRGPALAGILNGIDSASWDPLHDPHIEARFGPLALSMRAANRARLLADVGWDDSGGPIVMMVTRLAEQKGVDLALAAVPELPRLGTRLILLGSGDRVLAERASMLAGAFPDVMRFTEDFNEGLAHRMFAGSDLLLMPSRFEPCGLTQMQAMAYGTIPVVTPVGGLVDTVIDDDRARWQRVTASVATSGGRASGPSGGNGFVASRVDAAAVLDALRRAVRAWHVPARRQALQRRGMQHDWSWKTPARRYLEVYEQLLRA